MPSAAPSSNNNYNPHHYPNPPLSPSPFGAGPGNSPSVLFAKRKRNLFKGPMLALNTQQASGSGGRSGSASVSAGHSRSASASGLGRRSGEMAIQEEDEDEDEMVVIDDGDEEDIEEVEQFSPVIRAPGEKVEEIYEMEGESEGAGEGREALLRNGEVVSNVGAGTSK